MRRVMPFLTLATMLGLAHASPSTRTEARTVGPFHAVELAGTFPVEVQIGPAQHVEVTADESVIGGITTEVRDGQLIIGARHELHHCKACRVRVTTPQLDALELSGTGSMTATGVAAPSFAIAVGGTGSMEVSGTTNTVAYALGGTGSIDAKSLAAKSATVDIGGTGAIALRASHDVTVDVTGTGAVEVFGHPKVVRQSNTGPGRITMRD